MTQAEKHRERYSRVSYIAGHASESLTRNPEVERHPDSNALAQGWVFDDKSELWETDNNGIRTVYTTPPPDPGMIDPSLRDQWKDVVDNMTPEQKDAFTQDIVKTIKGEP